MRIIGILSFLLICQCTSTPVEKYHRVKVGMTKGKVVEIMGSPAATSSKGGLLKWYYYIKPGVRSSKRVMYFDGGFLTYKGPIIPPPITAEEADSLKKPKRKKSKVYEEPYEQKLSDEKLRKIIKKDIKKRKKRKKKKKTKPRFEEI